MAKKRLPRRRAWEFYIWTLRNDNGHTAHNFEHIGHTVQKWPNVVFENLAKRQGFDRLQTDTTLVGGYFTNNDGACLVCVPYGMTPEAIYL